MHTHPTHPTGVQGSPTTKWPGDHKGRQRRAQQGHTSNSSGVQTPQAAPRQQAAPLRMIRQGKNPLAVCVATPTTPQGSAGPTPEHPRPSTALEQTAGPWRGHDGSYVHTQFNVRAHSGSVAHSHAPNITRKHGTHDAIYCTSNLSCEKHQQNSTTMYASHYRPAGP